MQMSLFTPSTPSVEKTAPTVVERVQPPDFVSQARTMLLEAVPDFVWRTTEKSVYSSDAPLWISVSHINGDIALHIGVDRFWIDSVAEIGPIVSDVVTKLRGQWDRKVKVTTDGELVLDDPPVVVAGKGDFWSSPGAPTRAELVNLVTGSNYPADWLPDTAQSYAGCEVCGGWLEGIGGGMYITHPECIRAWYNVVLGAKMRFEEQAYRELAAEVGDKPKQTKKRAAP